MKVRELPLLWCVHGCHVFDRPPWHGKRNHASDGCLAHCAKPWPGRKASKQAIALHDGLAHCDTWVHIATHGCTLQHMGAHYNTWVHIATHGCTGTRARLRPRSHDARRVSIQHPKAEAGRVKGRHCTPHATKKQGRPMPLKGKAAQFHKKARPPNSTKRQGHPMPQNGKAAQCHKKARPMPRKARPALTNCPLQYAGTRYCTDHFHRDPSGLVRCRHDAAGSAHVCGSGNPPSLQTAQTFLLKAWRPRRSRAPAYKHTHHQQEAGEVPPRLLRMVFASRLL